MTEIRQDAAAEPQAGDRIAAPRQDACAAAGRRVRTGSLPRFRQAWRPGRRSPAMAPLPAALLLWPSSREDARARARARARSRAAKGSHPDFVGDRGDGSAPPSCLTAKPRWCSRIRPPDCWSATIPIGHLCRRESGRPSILELVGALSRLAPRLRRRPLALFGALVPRRGIRSTRLRRSSACRGPKKRLYVLFRDSAAAVSLWA